jgi:adenosylhomocysteine nucleosidase
MKTELLIITALESELKRDSLPNGVEIAYSGVGKINATIATSKAIAQYSPNQILNFGTVGKINVQLSGLIEIGKVIQRDMNAEPLAPRGKTPFCSLPSFYHALGGEYICGSGDSFVTAQDTWLISQKIDVVDMELFAIAAVAHQFNIPWRSYKYITDEANEDAGQDWHKRVNHGQELFLEVLTKILPVQNQ